MRRCVRWARFCLAACVALVALLSLLAWTVVHSLEFPVRPSPSRYPRHVLVAFWVASGEDCSLAAAPPDALLGVFMRHREGGDLAASALATEFVLPRREGNPKSAIHAMALATSVRRTWSGEELATGLADHAYLFRGATGISDAALRWFGLPVDELAPVQAAFLAGQVGHANLAPDCNPRRVLDVVNRIAHKMQGCGVDVREILPLTDVGQLHHLERPCARSVLPQ